MRNPQTYSCRMVISDREQTIKVSAYSKEQAQKAFENYARSSK